MRGTAAFGDMKAHVFPHQLCPRKSTDADYNLFFHQQTFFIKILRGWREVAVLGN